MQPLMLRPRVSRTTAPPARRFDRQVRVAGSKENAVGRSPMPSSATNASRCAMAPSWRANTAMNGVGKVLGNEDRHTDALGQRVEEDAERVDPAGRRTDRQHVDRIGRASRAAAAADPPSAQPAAAVGADA